MPRAIVHIGTHKTGTTTFQRWARMNRNEIQKVTGFRFYESMYQNPTPSSHFEFAHLAVRPEQTFEARRFQKNWNDPAHQKLIREHIEKQLNGEDIIISSEDLSLIRFHDEVDRFQSLLGAYEPEYIVVRRDPEDFLRSYRKWMKANSLQESTDSRSHLYLGPDTWLLDVDSLDALFPALRWLGYEDAMESHGSIIPALVTAMGFDPEALPPWKVPPLNSGNRLIRRVNRLRWRRRHP